MKWEMRGEEGKKKEGKREEREGNRKAGVKG